jgi:hypothetical protein
MLKFLLWLERLIADCTLRTQASSWEAYEG